MNHDGEPNQDRFGRLESSLAEVRHRLNRIEMRLGMAAASSPPMSPKAPPPQTAPIMPKFDMPRVDATRTPPDENGDAELQFGSVVLPRVGAGVMLLGIVYLVGLGISRGWITPLNQFIGAIVLCLGFIGIGLWKRQERFEFGQLMIGMGSCGLYLAFAAAHAFQNLFSGEVLVASFAALSFLNLGYGALSPSRTFVGIGLLGGLIAALLPMRENHIAVSLWLNLAITIPAAAIVARHKWRKMALATWAASTSAMMMPVFEPTGIWQWQIAAFYGITAIGLLAYAWVHEDWSFDPQGALIPFAAVLAGFVGFGRHGGVDALWHELALGAGLALASSLIRGKTAQNGLRLGAILAPFVFAPLGLPGSADTWTYLVLALAAAGLIGFALPKLMTWLAGIGLGAGMLTYLAHISAGVPFVGLAEEVGILVLALATVVLGAISLAKRYPEAEIATFATFVLASPLVSRIAALLMGQPPVELPWELAANATLLLLAAVSGVLALRRRWMLSTLFAWGAFFVAALLYIGHVTDHSMGFSLELTILAAMGVVAGLSGSALERTGGKESGAMLAGFMGWGVFSRIVFLIASQPDFGMTLNASLTLSWTLYAVAILVAGFLLNLKSLRLTSLAIFGVTVGKVLLVDLAALDPTVRVVLLLLLGGGMIAGGYAYVRRSRTLGGPPAGAAA